MSERFFKFYFQCSFVILIAVQLITHLEHTAAIPDQEIIENAIYGMSHFVDMD